MSRYPRAPAGQGLVGRRVYVRGFGEAIWIIEALELDCEIPFYRVVCEEGNRRMMTRAVRGDLKFLRGDYTIKPK